MDRESLTDACWVEHQILEHVKAALRVTLDWKVPAVGVSRKVSSVQFTLKSFQRHLDRLMKLEEGGGYLDMVAESKPNLYEQVQRLRDEHEAFRQALKAIIPTIDAISQADEPDREQFEQVCTDIGDLLEQVDEHDRREVDLLQDALLLDEGGEG